MLDYFSSREATESETLFVLFYDINTMVPCTVELFNIYCLLSYLTSSIYLVLCILMCNPWNGFFFPFCYFLSESQSPALTILTQMDTTLPNFLLHLHLEFDHHFYITIIFPFPNLLKSKSMSL